MTDSIVSLSIIIVNYRSMRLALDCINTIYKETSNITFEIIVVDNASGDDSESLLKNSYPAVRWIQMGYNAGFARANNQGIRQSNGEAALLLNPDILIENKAIENCCRQFARSSYVACGVQLLNEDRTPQISGNYFMTGGLNHLLPLPYIGNFIKSLGNLVKVKKPNVPDTSEETPVDWINGAFLMVKKKAIEKAGLLDEDFFLYAEEAEWCSRLKKTGKLCIYGQFKVIHLQGETANQAFDSSGKGYYNMYDRKGLQIMLSNLVRIRKQFGSGWYLFQLLFFTFTIPVFFIFSFIENLFTLRNPFRDFGRAGRFTGNVMRLWKYLPRIISGKPYFYKVL
jgi:GT2 family glycosyltransferase